MKHAHDYCSAADLERAEVISAACLCFQQVGQQRLNGLQLSTELYSTINQQVNRGRGLSSRELWPLCTRTMTVKGQNFCTFMNHDNE